MNSQIIKIDLDDYMLCYEKRGFLPENWGQKYFFRQKVAGANF